MFDSNSGDSLLSLAKVTPFLYAWGAPSQTMSWISSLAIPAGTSYRISAGPGPKCVSVVSNRTKSSPRSCKKLDMMESKRPILWRCCCAMVLCLWRRDGPNTTNASAKAAVVRRSVQSSTGNHGMLLKALLQLVAIIMMDVGVLDLMSTRSMSIMYRDTLCRSQRRRWNHWRWSRVSVLARLFILNPGSFSRKRRPWKIFYPLRLFVHQIEQGRVVNVWTSLMMWAA